MKLGVCVDVCVDEEREGGGTGKREARAIPGSTAASSGTSGYGNGRNKSIRREETRSSPKNDGSCEMT